MSSFQCKLTITGENNNLLMITAAGVAAAYLLVEINS